MSLYAVLLLLLVFSEALMLPELLLVMLSVVVLVLKIVPLRVLVLVRVLIPGGLPGGDVTMVLVRNLRKYEKLVGRAAWN